MGLRQWVKSDYNSAVAIFQIKDSTKLSDLTIEDVLDIYEPLYIDRQTLPSKEEVLKM